MLRIDLTCGQAEAQDDAADARHAAEAVGGAQPPAEVDPTAAAANAPHARFSSSWVHCILQLILSIPIPVLAPLPYVTVHLIQAPRVRLKLLDRHCLFPVLPFLTISVGMITVIVRLLRRQR